MAINNTVDGAKSAHDCHNNNKGNRPRNIRHPREHAGCVIHALQHHSRKTCCQTNCTTCRQVSTLGNQTSGYAAGNDETRGYVYNQVFKVIYRKKVFCNCTGKSCQNTDRIMIALFDRNFFISNDFCIIMSPPYSNLVASAMIFS